MQAAFRVRIYPFVKNDDKPFIFLIFLHLDELGLFVLLRCLKNRKLQPSIKPKLAHGSWLQKI